MSLPPVGRYATGIVFFPKQFELRQEAKQHCESVIERYAQTLISWRIVPTNNQRLGKAARDTEPCLEQVFVEAAEGISNDEFERILFFIRRTIMRTYAGVGRVYICSLSPRIITYKGMLTPEQVNQYFIDVGQKDFESHCILVHSRFSTNTFPSWERAQPLRVVAHNGEINTLRGNTNWMKSREGTMASELMGDELGELFPTIENETSDSGALDNVLELLVRAGRSMEEAVVMMVPEPWQNDLSMSKKKKAFYEYQSNVMEPWDGPAFIGFTNGRVLGAVLDRNGLRPGRYVVTKDGVCVLASEVGVLDIPDDMVAYKGRLTPGEMFLVDFDQKRIINDGEIKDRLANANPYSAWLKKYRINLPAIVPQSASAEAYRKFEHEEQSVDTSMLERLKAHGYTTEQLNMIVGPMASQAYEALGSMGNDEAMACLSREPRSPFDYFQQMFAQVTNPPIDPIRESIVMSLSCPIGPQGNLLQPNETNCARVVVREPVLSPKKFFTLTHLPHPGWEPHFLDITWAVSEGPSGMERRVRELCEVACRAVTDGARLVVLSDKNLSRTRIMIPSLIAVGALHQQLVANGLRGQTGIIVQCGDANEVHHHSLLIGFGADAIYPHVVYEAAWKFQQDAQVKDPLSMAKMVSNYRKSCHKGMLKVMSKMGISTLQSYKGAQIFEALGVGQDVISLCFTGCASRIGGLSFERFAEESLQFHGRAFPIKIGNALALTAPGKYHWRQGANTEVHLNAPEAIAQLQEAARSNSRHAYSEFAQTYDNLNKRCTIRGQLRLRTEHCDAISIDRVEPVKDIVKRFATGAMSYGSISIEAHSTLAVAMNRLNGKSNTGEGGEHISRYEPAPHGQSSRSAIKQVASGRFGVTIHYLTNSDEIQIKMAQGAKPGEGGELPGHKVVGEIAKTRNSTPGVGLISPPPHHDIYSIEDLAQLIFDLKNANPSARISVKLVSEVGVGVIATGVAKGHAEHILISGHDGGTGASKWTGIKHAGLPWELGLAETHQCLVKNGLRSRVRIQTDGQLKTGLDVIKATLLGAEEFCFATAPLIALGCIMMRKCHLNTCPVGIATQDPELRKMFSGQPEHVMNYFFLVAEEVRGYMAQLGITKMDDLVGRADLLAPIEQTRLKTMGLDLSALLVPAATMNDHNSPMIQTETQNFDLDNVLDRQIIKRIGSDVTSGNKVLADFYIRNTDRATGTILSHEITRKFGRAALPPGTVHLRFKGSAGQSFGAFCARGIVMELNGDANDYVGKGLSGGQIIVYPPRDSTFKAEENVIVGNVVLYGATSGQAFFSGRAAQRFCVRNSGAQAVVEGMGDHGCEYMTGGVVVCLGPTGRNFGAGMSGGVAYVWDKDNKLKANCNLGLVQLEHVELSEDVALLKELVDSHRSLTGSAVADRIMWNWDKAVKQFVKVIPTDYKRALTETRAAQEAKLKASVAESAPAAPVATGYAPAKDIEDVSLPNRPVSVSAPTKRRGFVEYERGPTEYRKPEERAQDFKEIYTVAKSAQLKTQAARCMDCGVPFCHQETTGCPLGNKIPEWNDLVYNGRWREALERLLETNNFPEFTGRVCPAPCEGACVLSITDKAVTIKNIEVTIIDRAFAEGWIVPQPPKVRTGNKVAIVGSGPAGLAAADQLNKAGHLVTVYERDDRVGGLLMYGVPNMKLDKKLVVERRVELLRAEGITFVTNTTVGLDVKAAELQQEYDAIILATGATKPRDLPIPGRHLKGVGFAMDFLSKNTKSYMDSKLADGQFISARGKRVLVIGGGDTGNDCIGTSVRHGAKSVTNFELLPIPPTDRAVGNPWPQWPRIHRVDYGHTEVKHKYGEDPREFSVLSKCFLDDGNGNVSGVQTVQIQWTKTAQGTWSMAEMEGSSRTYPVDLVLLAMGFVGPETGVSSELGLDLDHRGNYKAQYGKYTTNVDGVFACGDCRRGQSLVVWGIAEGRQCAREVDKYLTGSSVLP